MLGPQVIKEAPLEIQKLMLRLQDYGIKSIVSRIIKNGRITSSDEYKLTTMMEQDIFDKDFKEEIRKLLGISDSAIDRIFTQAAESNYIYDKRAFIDHGIPFVPFEENYFVQSLTKNIIDVTNGQMKNITNSLGFAIRVGNKLLFQPIASFYQQELDFAVTSVASGMKTFDQALKDSIYKMANSGLRTVTYPSQHMDRIDVAARRAVMGGMRDLTNAQSEHNAELMMSTVFEISWHGGHRPSHAWGGRRFDTSGEHYPTEEELYKKHKSPDGDVGTLEDYNCYHEKYAVFHDSPPKYTEDQLRKMAEDQNKKVEYEGKEYTEYEARQQQRYLERVIRKQQSLVSMYEEWVKNGDPDGIITDDLRDAKTKLRQTRKHYRDFSDHFGLTHELDRIIIY